MQQVWGWRGRWHTKWNRNEEMRRVRWEEQKCKQIIMCGDREDGTRWGKAHSEHRFLAPSSTLRAPLSGTFLWTLPDLVTPLKRHSLSPRSCPPTRSAPSERFGYQYDCGRSLAPTHARKHEAHTPRVMKGGLSRFKQFCLFLSWRKQHGHL